MQNHKLTDISYVISSDLQWNWQTIVIGVSFLAFLITSKYLVRISFMVFSTNALEILPFKVSESFSNIGQAKKKKKFFWLSAMAPLTSVILSTVFVYVTRADKKGVAIVSTY